MKTLKVSVFIAIAFALSGWASACSSNTVEGDGESHFLSLCTADCATGLDCICGVCTKPCDANAVCAGLTAGATCLEGAGCGGPPARTCGVACVGNSDCAGFGASACSDGACRSPLSLAEGGRAGERDASVVQRVHDGAVLETGSSVQKPETSGTPAPDIGTRESSVEPPPPAPEGGGLLDDGGFPCATVEWQRDGETSSYVHRINSCFPFTYTKADRAGNSCLGLDWSLGAPGQPALVPDDLYRVLDASVVRNAFKSAAILFGRDLRPVDGPVNIVTVNGHTVTVGAPCTGATGCVDEPPEIAALLSFLHFIEDHEAASGVCRAPTSCYAPPDPGSCGAALVRFAYVSESGGCKEFTYGGCGGNDNRFVRKDDCEHSCAFDPCLTRLGAGADAGSSTTAADWAFADSRDACACACAMSGSTAACRVSAGVATCP